MRIVTTVVLCCLPALAAADPARIEAVEAHRSAQGWSFAVTLRHAETGWEDYADGWRAVAPDGRVLGTRVLAHPHVDEQPFTRSLAGVEIPVDISEVAIESRTTATGWSGDLYPLTLPRE